MRKGLQNGIQHLNQLTYSARAYHSFHYDSMKRQGILQLPPGWDASPSQGYPQQFIRLPQQLATILLYS